MSTTSNTKGTVLISGITGFIATYVALAFFEAGWNVRGTGRSQQKLDEWIGLFPSYKNRFEGAIVLDIGAPGAFDQAVKGCTAVAHTASPVNFAPTDNERDLLIPAIQGTLNMLRACSTEPKVKRVVITSSIAAVIDLSLGNAVGRTYNSDDWNPATYDQAKGSDNPGFVYCASKVLSDKAAHDYVKNEKAGFAVTTLCPPMVFGAPLNKVKSMKDVDGGSVSQIYDIFSGNAKELPKAIIPFYVDVREVARAHVLSVELPVAANNRYLLGAGDFAISDIATIIAEEFPELNGRILPHATYNGEPHYATDVTKAEKELGLKWRSLRETVVDTVTKLIQLEKEVKA